MEAIQSGDARVDGRAERQFGHLRFEPTFDVKSSSPIRIKMEMALASIAPTRQMNADIAELLRTLVEGGVEFIVVGGAAAVLHGAPVTTLARIVQ